MLSRKNRFHGHGSVRRVYKQGRPVRGSYFSLHVNRHEKVKRTKVAVVVSRKIHKSAVKRNRIRRRIYEHLRLRLDRINPPSELVFTVYKSEVSDIPAGELAKAIDDLLEKARL